MDDPRRTHKGNLRHKLSEIMLLVVSAVVSGADDWEAIELFGKEQLGWLKKFGDFTYGTPSDSTLCRLFAAIDPDQFVDCFVQWVSDLCNIEGLRHVAIDGKRLRGAYDASSGKAAIHMISAFASENGICLGQVATEQKSNEITAIPALLELIMVRGSIITIDAMGCQKDIAEKVIQKGGDYILAVKQNQEELHQQVEKLFSITAPADTHTQQDCGHGRVETRKCTLINDLAFMDTKEQWQGINCVIKVETERFTNITSKAEAQVRYYISSLLTSAEGFNQTIRSHWSIENNLHWVLDVVFGEDASRRRKGNAAQNFSIILKTAMTLLKTNRAGKASMPKKRFKATMNPNYRQTVLGLVK